jgi:hypothetical protein
MRLSHNIRVLESFSNYNFIKNSGKSTAFNLYLFKHWHFQFDLIAQMSKYLWIQVKIINYIATPRISNACLSRNSRAEIRGFGNCRLEYVLALKFKMIRYGNFLLNLMSPLEYRAFAYHLIFFLKSSLKKHFESKISEF